jgi:translation initiation factor 1
MEDPSGKKDPMSKKKSNPSGIVYSTDPDFRLGEDGYQERPTLAPAEQRLKVRLDTRQRAGKAVTVVEGFEGRKEDLQELGKRLRVFCGSGGSIKQGELIIQGDHRSKLVPWLIQNGFTRTRQA